MRGDGEIGQHLLLCTCFQLWLQNSSFTPFSLLGVICPLVHCMEQKGWWAGGDHSKFAVLSSLLPCAHPRSSLPPTLSRDGAEVEHYILPAGHLLVPQPCNLASLQMLSRHAQRGEIFSSLSIPEDIWVVGVFYHYLGNLLFHFLFHFFYSQSL